VGDDSEVFVLIEGIETDPESEPIGQGDLFFDRFARVDLAAPHHRFVVRLIFRHQVATVGCGVDEQVVTGSGDGAIQNSLERAIAGLGVVKGEVVAIDDETPRAVGDAFDDVRQLAELFTIDFDQAQSVVGKSVKNCLHQRRLAGTARAGQQHIIGWTARNELRGVLLDLPLVSVNAQKVAECDAVWVQDRLAATAAPAKCRSVVPVDRGGRANALQRFGDAVKAGD
jgi:hypothetical protein